MAADTITFQCGAATITLPAPMPEYGMAHERAQAHGQTAAAEWYHYDKAVTTRTATITLRLTSAEKANLETFFRVNLQGGLVTFIWTDHVGGWHPGCFIVEPALKFTKTRGARYDVALQIVTPDLVD